MTRNLKKLLSLLLAMCMAASMLVTPAMAADDVNESNEAVVEVETDEEPTSGEADENGETNQTDEEPALGCIHDYRWENLGEDDKMQVGRCRECKEYGALEEANQCGDSACRATITRVIKVTDGYTTREAYCGVDDNGTLHIWGNREYDLRITSHRPQGVVLADLMGGFTSVVIHEGITALGEQSFEGAEDLVSVEIADTVTSIGASAFSSTGLKNVVIPASVESIGANAFYNCLNLTEVTFDKDSQLTSIGSNAFSDCANLNSFTFPDKVEKIETRVFGGSTPITSVEIPESVRVIRGAFTETNVTDYYMTLDEANSLAKTVTLELEQLAGPEGAPQKTLHITTPVAKCVADTWKEKTEKEMGTRSGHRIIELKFAVVFDNVSGDHAYVVRVTPEGAGCDVERTAITTCEKCGYSSGEIKLEANQHNWVVTGRKDATCTEAGYISYKCIECEKATKQEPLTALEHVTSEQVLSKPTCTAEGSKGYVCERCGETVGDTTTIGALGHKWGEWEETTRATCEATGVETRTCENDASHTETREIPMLSHEYPAGGGQCQKGCNRYQLDNGALITPPEGEEVTDNEDGTKNVPGGSTVTDKAGNKIELDKDGTLDKDGKIETEGKVTVTDKDGNKTVIDPNPGNENGENKVVIDTSNGKVTIPGGSEVENGNGKSEIPGDPVKSVTVPTGKVDEIKPKTEDEVELPSGSSVEKEDGSKTELPYGGSVKGNGKVTVNPNPNPPSFGGGFGGFGGGEDIEDEDPPLSQPFLFDDVTEDKWYYESLKYMFDQGLMNGISDRLFGPNMTTTRGMLVTILYRMEGEPEMDSASSFSDVRSNAYYASAVVWAEANGIVLGYGDGTYGPNDLVTREQMAAILHRYASFKGYDVSASNDLSSFPDGARVHGWALNDVQWAAGAELIRGGSNGALNPRGTATRAEMAQMLMRFCQGIAASDWA